MYNTERLLFIVLKFSFLLGQAYLVTLLKVKLWLA
jgi:hypothetical protein